MMYDDNGNPILGYDDNGKAIPAPSPTRTPAAKPSAKPKPQEPGVLGKIGELITAGMQSVVPFAPLIASAANEDSRPMSARESAAYKSFSTPRDRAKAVSEARASEGTIAGAKESLFPASEAARRADIAEGMESKGLYALDHPGTFIGDALSLPVRAGAATLANLPRLAYDSYQYASGEGGSPFEKYQNRVQNWMTDPTGMTGSPSSALFLMPMGALKTAAGVGKSAVGVAPKIGEAIASSPIARAVMKKAGDIALSYPKAISGAKVAAEGALNSVTGYKMDQFGGHGGGGAGIPALFGGLAGFGGRWLQDASAHALPGFKAMLAEEMKKAAPRQAVAKEEELRALMMEQLKKIGILRSFKGRNAVNDVANENLDRSGELYDRVDRALSPRVHALLKDRPSTMKYNDLIDAGMTEGQARRWARKVPITGDARGENLIWTSPKKEMMDIADPEKYGPNIDVGWHDFLDQGEQRINDAAYYGAPGASAESGEGLLNMFHKKANTIQALEAMDQPGSKMYLEDLARIRRQANVKHGKTIKAGFAGLQNLVGSEGLGEFATKFKYGNNRKMTKLGLEPVAREAGKLYKEGKVMQALASGDVKTNLRAGNTIENIANMTEQRYRLPLLMRALGEYMEKSTPKFGSRTGER